ncbi:MAG: peptide chain release factor N(5)-glutamine methyltransferase [Candidatus Marinarcus sp.]|uniref:peptide chain release factor N(5)-glutamine methyltransferase n=1 Tax=Candidatus Marinarcus sp. TaxID=3100987 RepID=UPI003AFFA374
MTIQDTIKKYAKELNEVTHIPAKEVEILMLHLLNKNVIWLHLNFKNEFEFEKELAQLVKKRATHFPLEYLIEKVSFYGETFHIKEGVLIPRPETELLVENAYNILKEIKGKKRILEIGIGSGIISCMLALLLEDVEIVGVDINEKAISLAKENAKKHKVENKISFIKSDLFENVTGDFLMCISNPPYIASNYILPSNVKYEPENALFSGEFGDELLKKIIDKSYEKKVRYLLCEMGYDQKKSLSEYLKKFNTKSVEFYQDYAKFDRGFSVEFKH